MLSNSELISQSIETVLSEHESALQAAIALFGDMDKALQWYSAEPLAPFAGRTAARLVAVGRCNDVLSYLSSIDAG